MLPLRQMLFGRKSPAVPAALPTLSLAIGQYTVDVKLKRHATAGRMVLRLARDGESFTLTLPKRQSLTSAQAFLEKSRLWMQNTLAHRGRRDSQSRDDTVVLRGVSHAIVRTGKLRGLVQHDRDGQVLQVPGSDAHWKRRLTEWLKAEAEKDLKAASQLYADKMTCSFRRVTVRDQQSRWGSCSSDGSLSYSWRLILAPQHVLDYVAAHEVAHLLEMNHGPRFWRLVLTHCPHTRASKQWLKQHGHTLHHLL
jgi:predicted metal-dependent hydrolase